MYIFTRKVHAVKLSLGWLRILPFELIFAVFAFLLSQQVIAYERKISAPWLSPARTASYLGAASDTIPVAPPGFHELQGGPYYTIDISGIGYGVPEDALNRAIKFGNDQFSSARKCRDSVTFKSLGCTVVPAQDSGGVICTMEGTAADRGEYYPWDDNCHGEGSIYRVRSDLSMWKGCPRNAEFDPVSRQCMCPLGSVFNTKERYCAPVLDRFVTKPCDSCHGNPVMGPIGAKTQSIDLGWQPWLPLRLTFNTMRRISYSTAAEPFMQSDAKLFGDWVLSLERQVYPSKTPSGFRIINVARGSGFWTTFNDEGVGNLTPSSGEIADQLIVDAEGYLYRDSASRLLERYDHDGNLVQITRADGPTLSFNRSMIGDDSNLPLAGIARAIVDHFGRIWRFEYTSTDLESRAVAIIDPALARVTFTYTPTDQIKTITWSDGSTQEFLYEHSLPWAMTGYMDENGARAGTYSYDSEGRSTGTMRGSGADAYSFSWSSPSHWEVVQRYDIWGNTAWRDHVLIPAIGLAVTLPNGQTELVDSTSSLGSVKWTKKTQPAGAGSGIATAQRLLDSNQNVIQSVDYNGNISCMQYDSARNVEVARIDGLPASMTCESAWSALPAGARRTTTQWHPDWMLESNVALPGRIVTTVYNGQPDPSNRNQVAHCAPDAALLPDGKPIAVVCKRIDQPTLDAMGAAGFAAVSASAAARVRTWTYNSVGQILTERDELGRLTVQNQYYSDTTAEHTVGDLMSTINAAGHVTSYPRYNAYGQPLEMVDANGISTVYTYDVRSRLTSVTSAGQTTSYAYWPTGLLKQVTQPDGSSVSYEYDDAHRLVAVADNLGNRIQYTLDQRGNRTQEAVQDPSGALTRNLSRVFDALSRTQQTTGGE